MVSCHCHVPRHRPPPVYNPPTTGASNPSAFSFFSSDSYFKLHRRLPSNIKYRSGICHVAGPQPEPPPKKQQPSPSGLIESFTRFQDKLQIFFAVFFWMSLFFWSSAWDGGNNGSNKKGPRLRK